MTPEKFKLNLPESRPPTDIESLEDWATRVEVAIDRDGDKVNPMWGMIYRPHALADDALMNLTEKHASNVSTIRDSVDECDRVCDALRLTRTHANADTLLDRMMVLARRIRNLIRIASFSPPPPDGDNGDTGWLTVTEAATATGLPKGTITKWCDSDDVESKGKGRNRRVNMNSLAKRRNELNRKRL